MTLQVATLDGWGSIARAHVEPESNIMHLSSGVFFMSFLLIVAFTLLPGKQKEPYVIHKRALHHSKRELHHSKRDLLTKLLRSVVVAVLLDNFTVATRNEKDKQLLKHAQVR